MGLVRCQKCRADVDMNSCVFDNGLKPICLSCSGHDKLMKELVDFKEKELTFVWSDPSQSELLRWIK